MSFKIVVAAAALLATANAGQLTIKNSCNFDTSIGMSQDNSPLAVKNDIAKNGGTYTQTLAGSAWVAKLWTPMSGSSSYNLKNITQIEWSLTDNLYFDVSLIDGDAFSGAGVSMTPSVSSCSSVICKPGIHCENAYHIPTQRATVTCNTGSDMTVDLCSPDSGSPFYSGSSSSYGSGSNSNSQSSNSNNGNGKQAPASPAQVQAAAASSSVQTPQYQAPSTPSPTPAAAAPQQDHGVHIGDDGHVWIPVETVYYTTFITKRSPQPTEAVMEKRAAHEHGHAHAHNAAHQNHA